jgi:pilus assembly protein CpaB
MSKMRIVMFALAAGSAVMAGILAKGMIGKKPAEVKTQIVNKVKTTPVLVAAKDINVGEKLSEGKLLWKEWPTDNVQEAMITKEEKPDATENFAENRAIIQIFEGEVINAKKLVNPEKGGFMSAVLPKGMRAVSIAISETSAAGGFILPNDRVDIVLTRKNDGKAKTEVVLSNVRVLAINQIFRPVKSGDEVALKEAQTATVELMPLQVEVIAKVESEGSLSLALRSIAETDGKAMEIGPLLADRYKQREAGVKPQTETLFIRYGRENFVSSK